MDEKKYQSKMDNSPKLSIITVTLNNITGLRKTIESVVSQTFTDFEYLIIDGGSTDGSVEIIKEFACKITYWVSEPDKGIYNAMNKGILQAKGEYCLFINSGDYLPGKDIFATVKPELLKGFNINYCNGYFEDKKRIKAQIPYPLIKEYFFHSSLIHPSTYIKREGLIKLGMFDETFKISADYDFFVKCFINQFQFNFIDIFGSVFSVGGISTNTVHNKLINEEIRLIRKKYFTNEEFLSQIESYELQFKEFKSYAITYFLFKLCKKLKKLLSVS